MDFVKYEERSCYAVITIDRPEALNALNLKVLEELGSTLDKITDFNKVRAMIITGAGEKSFVAGADIGEMSSLSKEEGKAFSEKGNKIFRRIETFPIPVIAAVNGFALGGGCELAMCCDIRLASENAVFGQPETGLGITPGFGGTQRLPRIVGISRASALIYSCDRIDAVEAMRSGLVNSVHSQEELMPEAEKLAERIARNAPIAVRTCKEAIRKGIEMDTENAISLEAELFGTCFETEDQVQGMTAFLEKRRPEPYKNR